MIHIESGWFDEFYNEKYMSEQKPEILSVTVVLTGESVGRFLEAVNKSGRSNRSEAKLRIEDHLEQFTEISSVGSRVKRK
ncbi:TraY domain-containing protein [Vibrio sp. 10N.261.45.A4]|uniref:TraY domain-containing protein n=2 Tax=unclassified Vibrio TaxID=2614977 RepID=UPI00354BEE5F